MKIRILTLLFVLAGCAFPEQGFSVVVRKDSPVNSISKALLRKMILGESAAWPSGAKASVLIGPVGNGAREAALKDICGMGESDFSKHALQASFGGGKTALKTLPSTAMVRNVVAITQGGVGIVESAEAGADLKILTLE